MQMRLFRAATAAQAMAQVRADFGDDALILGSRRVADGVEVTAAIERKVPDAPPEPAADPSSQARLAYHGIPPEFYPRLLDGELSAALGRAIQFAALPLDEPLMLVGPPGSGKTLTAARLATRMVMQGVSPMVVTTDGQRAGATEQLAAFTRLLRVNLVVASHPVTLGRAVARRVDRAPVLIDSAGSDPFVESEREGIRAYAATAGARIVLVLPAGLDVSEAEELACAYADTGASLLIATRLDLSRRVGGVVVAAIKAGLALTEGGVGPGAADGLVPLTAQALATRIAMPGRHAA